MATYYVWSGAGGTASGADWTNAFTTFGAGVTAATNDGDIIKVHSAHVEILAVDTTYTFANNVNCICVDKDNSDAADVMNGTTEYIGHLTTARSIIFAGAYKVKFYGLAFLVAGNDTFKLSPTDGMHTEFENCILLGGYNGGGLQIGGPDAQGYTLIKGGTFGFNGTSASYIDLCGNLDVIGATLNCSGTAPNSLIKTSRIDAGGCTATFTNCDLSALDTSPLVGDCTTAVARFAAVNCKLPASFSALATQTHANLSGGEVMLINCSSGDNHYAFGHHNSFGETVAVVAANGAICNDGATYDGTTEFAWKITTTANCSLYTPYVSPWIHKYHSGTSAITPYLEGLKTSETDTPWASTVAQNDEIWGEFAYQGTTGFPVGVLTNDRMPFLGTPADQTSTLTTSDWTIPTSMDLYKSTFKLLSPSITPIEIGPLSARVCVGEASKTFYIDPQIRT